MKSQDRAWLLALFSLGILGSAQAETFRCRQADGTVAFQQAPCSLAELVMPDMAPAPTPAAMPKPAIVAAPEAVPAGAASATPAPRPILRERLVTVPAAAAVAPSGTPSSDGP